MSARIKGCQRPIWMWWHPGLDAQQLPIERHILQMKAVAERGLHLPPACDLRAEGLMQQFCKASEGCMVCHGHISTFGYVWMAAWHIYKEVGKKGTCIITWFRERGRSFNSIYCTNGLMSQGRRLKWDANTPVHPAGQELKTNRQTCWQILACHSLHAVCFCVKLVVWTKRSEEPSRILQPRNMTTIFVKKNNLLIFAHEFMLSEHRVHQGPLLECDRQQG